MALILYIRFPTGYASGYTGEELVQPVALMPAYVLKQHFWSETFISANFVQNTRIEGQVSR